MDRKSTSCPICQEREIELKAIELKKKAEEKERRKEERLKRYKQSQDKKSKESNNNIILEKLINTQAVKYWDAEAKEVRGLKVDNLHLNRAYSWKCDNRHTWRADVTYMLDNPCCPKCFEIENSIASKYPNVIEYFDEYRNGKPATETLAIPTAMYWWKCRRGHNFMATLKQVLNHKQTGCMYCDKEKSYFSL